MPDVDDGTGGRVNSAPEGKGLLKDECNPMSGPIGQNPAPHGSPHRSTSRQTRPSAADRTHSLSEPNTTSTPMFPGA
jgi:hypothetical protein